MKFLAGSFKKVVPAYPTSDLDKTDNAFIVGLFKKFAKYVELMEGVKMKDGLRTAMEMSSDCNVYIQENQPWVLAKSDLTRCQQVLNVSLNALMMICVVMEPFMPSFSAKVYEQMAVKRELKHETAIKNLVEDQHKAFLSQLQGGHVIGTPEPIFREIKQAEADEWKKKYGGKE